MPGASLDSRISDPRKVAGGRLGARRRWGPEPRVVRLDDLTPPQRRLVLALVEAAKAETQKAAAVVSETSTDAAMEDDGGDRRLPRAS